MRMIGFRCGRRNPAKRGEDVSCAAHGHPLRNPRPSRGRFPGPSGHRGLMARADRAAGRVAGAGVGVVRRALHTAYRPSGSAKTGPMPPGPP